jgi:hypothetical protein
LSKKPIKFPADKGLKAGDEIIQIGDVVLADFKGMLPAF